MGHKYSDNCTCQKCTDTWNKALFAAIDRGEKRREKESQQEKERG